MKPNRSLTKTAEPAKASKSARSLADIEQCKPLPEAQRYELSRLVDVGAVPASFVEDVSLHGHREWDSDAFVVGDDDPRAHDLDALRSISSVDPSRYGRLAEQLGYVIVDTSKHTDSPPVAGAS